MEIFIIIITLILIFQSFFWIYSMLFTWSNKEQVEKNDKLKLGLTPNTTFTILLPAWHEQNVIADTLKSIDRLNYPRHLYEVLILLRPQDPETVKIAKNCLLDLPDNFKIIMVDTKIRNKPNQLNYGLEAASKEYISVLDAEDEPHPDLLRVIDEKLQTKKVDVIQSGVQLVSYMSNWFSPLNCLEYYFWFKSVMHLLSKLEIVPLGGNTLFINKLKLLEVGGWDEKCLTEDADVGLKLSQIGATMDVFYEEKYATQEETPHNLDSFVKQRTRWIQGFLQIFLKGKWMNQGSLKKQFLSFYLLFFTQLQPIIFFLVILLSMFHKFYSISLVTSIITIIPLLLMFIQFVLMNVGFYEFSKSFHGKYNWYMPIWIFITFIPYQLILIYCSLRAITRLLYNEQSWEKTLHLNTHRLNQ
jgi:glycosyltransferase XagB